jgi:Rrf2 family protein
MDVPRKTRYALRAIFELAKRYGQGPTKIIDVAKAQATPPRFLEVILGQLKQAGFVGSRRGKDGGYFLVRSPGDLTVGEVMRFIQGPIRLVGCSTGDPEDDCPLFEDCVFLPMWQEVQEAIANVYDGTTFQDFVDRQKEARAKNVRDYSI